MLIKLIADEEEIKNHNNWLQEMQKENPDDEFFQNIELIKSLDDIFIPYSDYINSFAQEEKEKYFKIPDDNKDTIGCYITELNYDGYLKRLVVDKLSDDASDDEFHFRFRCFGVCDNASQAINYYNKLLDEGYVKPDGKYVIMMTPLFRKDQSQFGWRWKKWGPYVGVQEHHNEYLYDEQNIELIYAFHIEHLE